jgi:hypothetical protein
MKKSTEKQPDGEFLQLILRDALDAKEARKAFPSPTGIAHERAENLSRLLHSSDGELERLEELEGVPGFEECEGLAGLEALDCF